MVKRAELVKWLDDYLDPKKIPDYCPNGLQVEGKDDIKKIVTGVSASLDFLQKASQMNADAVLVHHGIIWKGAWNKLTGTYKKKVQCCFENNMNLLAYHIPLDAHMEVGNAAAIAEMLSLTEIKEFGDYKGINTGVYGSFNGSKEELFSIIKNMINENAQIFDFSDSGKKIAIATGAAQSEFNLAIDMDADVFISGEVSEWVYHMAKEEKKIYIAAGHHASESYGVQKLAGKLASEFSIEWEHLDVHNPV